MPAKQRSYDIDWLRVLSMLMIFLFHNARFFNNEDWQVKNFGAFHRDAALCGSSP
ncbi:MAG: hypothetical protein R2911_16550 [Caldilineaceae bacterium]